MRFAISEFLCLILCTIFVRFSSSRDDKLLFSSFRNKHMEASGSECSQTFEERTKNKNFDAAAFEKIEVENLDDIDSLKKNHESVLSVDQWPNARIPTVIEGKFTRQQKLNMGCAINFFHTKTCIKFVEKKDSDKDYLKITIAKGISLCGSETVGRKGGEQYILLGDSGPCFNVGTIIHELAHAIGTYHQHQRSDRVSFISILRVPDHLRYQFIQQRRQQLFRSLGYDYRSIMHYPSHSGNIQMMKAKKGNVNKNTKAMGNRLAPTQLDVDKWNKLYKCDSGGSKREYNKKERILLIGGDTSVADDQMDSVEEFYPVTPSLNGLSPASLLVGRRNAVAVSLGNEVMVLGGYGNEDFHLNSVELFNGTDWSALPPMNVRRQSPAATVLDGHVCVCGGETPWSVSRRWKRQGLDVNGCECLAKNLTQWHQIPSMKYARSDAKAVEIDGVMFVVGGLGVKNIEKYEPKPNIWKGKWKVVKAEIPFRRIQYSVAEFGSEIWICGGMEEASYRYTNECSIFNPSSNRWRKGPHLQMNVERNQFSLVPFNDQLFAIGGNLDEASDSVEVYDEKSNKWTPYTRAKLLDGGRWQTAAVAL